MSSLESESTGKKPLREFKTKKELEQALMSGGDSQDFSDGIEYVRFTLDEMRKERRASGLLPSESELASRKQEYDYLVRNKVVQAFIPAATVLDESEDGFDVRLSRPKEEIIDSRIPMKVSLTWNFREEKVSNWKYRLLKIPPHQKVSWNEVEAHALYRNGSIEGISINGSDQGIRNDDIEGLKKAVDESAQHPFRRSYIQGDPNAIPDPRLRVFQERIFFDALHLYPDLDNDETQVE